jgi:lysophospholipase L1-like esterase
MRPVIRWSPLLLASALLVSACGDDTSPGPIVEPEKPDFARYAAIGTSISMGWASDGAIAASQEQSWPLQLAKRAGFTMTAPLLGTPGCRPPMQAPLASFRRISGDLLTVPSASLACTPTVPGVILPVANTAINNARAFDVRNTTPENITDLSNRALYARVLPPQTTQLLAATQQRPKFVSVELGANEVLGARDGRVLPGVTVVPVQAFSPDYDVILDRVKETATTGAVLVGLISDARSFPAFRSGNELWLNRAEFLAGFNVAIQPDCQSSPNYIVVPFRVPAAVAAGVTRAQNGLPPEPLSCMGGPPNVVDYVLDPIEITQLNDIIKGIDTYIATAATSRGWAFFRLEALYGRADLKEPFSVAKLMTTATPYGPLMSLDGFHPSAQGQTVLADAAAIAINARYRLGLPTGLMAMIAP